MKTHMVTIVEQDALWRKAERTSRELKNENAAAYHEQIEQLDEAVDAYALAKHLVEYHNHIKQEQLGQKEQEFEAAKQHLKDTLERAESVRP